MPLIGKSEVQSSTFGDEVQLRLLTLDSSILQKYSHRLNLNPFPDMNIDSVVHFGHTEDTLRIMNPLYLVHRESGSSYLFRSVISTRLPISTWNETIPIIFWVVVSWDKPDDLHYNWIRWHSPSIIQSEKIQIWRNWPSVILKIFWRRNWRNPNVMSNTIIWALTDVVKRIDRRVSSIIREQEGQFRD